MNAVVSRHDPAPVVQRRDTSIVVTRKGGVVVTRQIEARAVVVTRGIPGPPGPPGPPGGGAGATYTHTQSIPAAVWTVAHNLGRFPSVSVVDHLGGLLTPDVRYLDADLVQVIHSTPLIGKAYCN